MPNTEVKLNGAEDTWMVTSRKNRKMPTYKSSHPIGWLFFCLDIPRQQVYQTSSGTGEVPYCAGYFVPKKASRVQHYLVSCKGETQRPAQKRQARRCFGSFRGSLLSYARNLQTKRSEGFFCCFISIFRTSQGLLVDLNASSGIA